MYLLQDIMRRLNELIHFEQSLSKVLGPRIVLNFGFFSNFEILYIHSKILGGWISHLNTKVTCISYVHYTSSLKVILYDIFYASKCDCDLSYEIMNGIFACQSKTLRKFQILEYLGPGIFRLKVTNLYV